MIRPFTLVCMLMAGASGLYLYQSKHRAQMLDREIGRVINDTQKTRERIGMLKAEWALLNEPDRLAELSRSHLGLRTLQPTQFAAAADLAARLPAPVAPSAPKPVMDPEPDDATPPAIAQAAPPPPKSVLARAVPEPRPAIEPKQAVVAAEPKPAPVRVARPAPTPTPTPTPVPVAVAAAPRPAPAQVMSIAATSAATAPGTVGEAVLRAMRASSATYAPAPVHQAATPVVAQPVYAQPAYAAPAYAAPAYATQPAASLLGGSRGSLPPPVPFANR